MRRWTLALAASATLAAAAVPSASLAAGEAASIHRSTQQLDGLRVLWGSSTVAVRDGRATTLASTVVPLRGRTLRGEVTLTAAQAEAIAQDHVFGRTEIDTTELVAYAGEPDAPRPPRRAYVVGVAPLASNEEVPLDTVLVIDAETGAVLHSWRGWAARPADAAPADDATAATKTVLNQVVDAHRQQVVVTPDYRDLTTTGDPYLFDTTGSIGWDTYGTGLGAFAATSFDWTSNVGRFFCVERSFCGRDSGLPGPGGGTFNRNFFTVNWEVPGEPLLAGRYLPAHERVFLTNLAFNDPGSLAHEYGHQIDHVMQNDYQAGVESLEVDEALADMFAIDWERNTIRVGVRRPTITEQANSNAPTWNDYACGASGPYANGFILSHAYLYMAQKMGWTAAGRILQGVPWALPAKRTFASVKDAFVIGADAQHGVGSFESAVVYAAFSNARVTASSTRAIRCPGWPQ